jgi:hypothetical protein
MIAPVIQKDVGAVSECSTEMILISVFTRALTRHRVRRIYAVSGCARSARHPAPICKPVRLLRWSSEFSYLWPGRTRIRARR